MSENNKKDTEKAEEVQKDTLDKKTEVTVEQKLKEIFQNFPSKH